jgi:enoyl-CoA hydratase/carnithine racemase
LSEFECDTPFFRSKLTRNVVITQLGPDAFSILTDSETRSEYLKFVDAVGNSPGAKGYVLVNDRIFDGRVEFEELIRLISGDETEYRVHGAYRGMLHDVIAARFRNSVGKLFFNMIKFEKPAVAAFQGKIRGEYLGWTLAYDSRIATVDTVFDFDNARIGIPASPGVTYLMPRYIGMGRTMSLLYHGGTIDAKEALTLGLISDVVEDRASLEDRCIQEIQKIVEHHLHIHKAHKKLLRPTGTEISQALERYYKQASDSIVALRSNRTSKIE